MIGSREKLGKGEDNRSPFDSVPQKMRNSAQGVFMMVYGSLYYRGLRFVRTQPNNIYDSCIEIVI